MAEIEYEVADRIATLTINRPEKRGAMTYRMLAEFRERIGRADADPDPDVRVLILAGRDGSFCAGIDLADLAGRNPEDRAEIPPDSEMAVLRCAKPVIAAIDGPAVGMGAELTCQADLRIASTRARFAWNFGHRGLVPDMGAGSWLLPRQIGLPAALRLLFTGEPLDSEEALRLGYVTEVVSPEDLVDAATALAVRVAATSPFASRRTKSLVYEGTTATVAQHLAATRAAMAQCFASEDHAEGVASFLERRPARFSGC